MNSDEIVSGTENAEQQQDHERNGQHGQLHERRALVEPRLHIRAAFLKELYAVDDENADKK